MSGRATKTVAVTTARVRPSPAVLLLVLAALLLVALSATACGDDGGSPDAGGSAVTVDPVALLDEAAAKMSADGFTAHFAFGSQLDFDRPSGSESFTATGSGDLEMPTALRYVVDVLAGEGGGSLEVVTVDGVTYYTRDANDSEQPWTASDSPMAVPFNVGGEIARYLGMATDTTLLKTVEEDGQRVHVVRVTMDPVEYANGRAELDMAAVLGQTFGLSPKAAEEALAGGLAFAEFKVGEDDGYVHDLTERWLIRLEDGGGFLQEVALSFSRFGTPLEPPIEVPATD